MSARRDRVLCSPLLAIAMLTTACGDDTAAGSGGADGSGGSASTTTGGTGGGDATTGAGGGPLCPDGSDPVEGSCAPVLGAWTAGPSLIDERDHHVTFVATSPSGSYLYAAAGTNGFEAFDSIERATIAADGSLGAFEAAGTVPVGLIGPGLAQVDRSVVIAGGLVIDGSAAASTADTAVGVVGDDGSITFEPGPELIHDRYHVSLVADRGFVFALGGLAQSSGSQSFIDAVERATFDGTTLGDFEELEPLPLPLTHQSVVVWEHQLLVVGGLTTGGDTSLAIWRSAIGEDGALGAWDEAGTLPEARATSAAFVHEDMLYVVGGATLPQGGEVPTVLRAAIDAEGAVGTFEELAALPKARAHAHQAPLFEDTVYSVGGAIGNAFQGDVFLARLAPLTPE